MLAPRLFRLVYRFAIITPEIYPNLLSKFTQRPDTTIFGEYYQPENLVQVFNIIREAKVNPAQKVRAYEQVQQNLCKNTTDMQFNILANICRDKSLIFLGQGRVAEAIAQIQRAITAIQGMEKPFSIEVASLLQIASNLHIRTKNYTIAKKYLKDAEHTLNIAEEELLENLDVPQQVKQQQLMHLNSILAKVMSDFCLVHMQLTHLFEARSYLAKAIQRFQKLQRKNTLAYLMTIKFKCILHVWAKEKDIAVQTAREYLERFEQNQETAGHRLWFMKFLIDQGVETYAQELKTSIEELSKSLGQKELSLFLVNIGVIKKPRDEGSSNINKQGKQNQGQKK